MPPKTSRSRLISASLVATVVTAVVAFLLPRDFSVGNFVDDAHYAVLAKSMRVEGTYRTLNLPHQPFETKYPPGFPALLALVWSPDQTDLENIERSRWVNIVMVGPTAGALTALGVTAMQLNPWTSAALAVAGLTAPRTMAIWTVPLSGLLFLLCCTVGLLLYARLPPGWRLVVLSLSVYVRTIAIAFAVAAIGVAWFRKNKGWEKDAIVLGVVVAPWLLWQFANRNGVPAELLGVYGSYGAWYLQSLLADVFTVLVRVPVTNVRDIFAEIGVAIVGRGWLPNIVTGAVGVIVVWRLVVAKKVDATLRIGLFVYALIIIAWPFPPDRFVAGVWPFVLLAVAATLGRMAWALAMVTVVLSGWTLWTGEAIRFHRSRSALTAEVFQLADLHVQTGDVLASTNAGLYYLRYAVPSVPGQRMRSYRRYRLGYWSTAWGLGDDVWDIIQLYEVTKVIVEVRGVEGRYALGSLVGQCPEVASQLWETDSGAMMFAVDPAAECTPRRPPS